ncbi:hypothetical protein KAX75_08310 [candidate division WOR-3 bacterium]|nr:hypothetical protein [candidate division WOR-3 bacterium]
MGIKAERNRVVARFKDGNLLKGFTLDFSPVKDIFHLVSEQDKDKGKSHEVEVEELKAIFFVKSLQGNKGYYEKKKFEDISDSKLQGMKIRVEFIDGEIIRGKTLVYSSNRKGFFVFPVDPNSNNEKIYCISSAVREVETGSDAKY